MSLGQSISPPPYDPAYEFGRLSGERVFFGHILMTGVKFITPEWVKDQDDPKLKTMAEELLQNGISDVQQAVEMNSAFLVWPLNLYTNPLQVF